MGTRGRRFATVLPCLPWALTAACTPVESNLGGTRPPPVINDSDAGAANGDDGLSGEPRTMVFDVVIEASSLTVDGIAVEATLTVVTDEGDLSIQSATLRDTANNFQDSSAPTGIAGGIFLSASAVPRGDGSEFTLSVADDGSVVAVFSSSAGVPGLFVLQSEGSAFDPGAIGDAYPVQAVSSFGFRIDGNVVAGTMDLNGVSISGAGGVEVYNGTFTGSLRSP